LKTTLTMNKLPKYPAYKSSGVEWLGDIPEHWEVIKLKFICQVFNGDSIKDDKKSDFMSTNESDLPYISTKDIDFDYSKVDYINGLKIPTSNKKFKIAPRNSFLLCIEGGSAGKKIGFLSQDVCFVNKLACFKCEENYDPKYLYYFMKSSSFQNQFQLSTTGLIGGVAISLIRNFDSFFPPKEEQVHISQFLDDKTAHIDKAIGIKEKQIELLKERRQIFIHRAVTRGLNPNVKLKNSGVEWIGEIPEHWEVKKVKYILKERNERSVSGLEPLLMMSQIHGLVVRADYHDKAKVAQSNEGNKIVYKNDLVFNKLKAHLGVFFKSNIEFKGIVSPDYAVYYSTGIINDLKYLELLFRNPEYIREFICRATGIVEGLIRLYTHELFDIPVSVPPIKEQTEILEYINISNQKIATAIFLKELEIEKLKEYKASLINEVVTGKVRIG
jgi:type I restriction enzyme S subunit